MYLIQTYVTGQPHADIIELLVNSGANVDMLDRGSQTPLHLASKTGRVENVQALLHKGARVDVIDSSGQTALHLAAAKDPTGEYP